jgi:hypothetical protein
MRTGKLFLVSLLVLLAGVSSLRAGVYFPADPRPWPLPRSADDYYSQLLDLQTADTRVKGTPLILGAKVLAEKERLETVGNLSLEDRINLGGCYALIAHRKAESMLSSALARAPNNFMVTASLATVYLTRSPPDLEAALRFQTMTLDNWPRVYPGWSSERLRWYRRVELLTLEMIKARLAEKANPRKLAEGRFGRGGPVPEDLFPGVKFIVPGRPFVPGQLDTRMRDKLPADALPLVEQLLFSMPQDHSLLALLAELFNAQGEIVLAYRVFNKLDPYQHQNQGGMSPFTIALRARVKILEEFIPLREELLLSMAMPGAALAQEMGRSAVLWHRSETEKPPNIQESLPPRQASPQSSTDQPSNSSWLPDWRPLVVGLAAGFVSGMLVLLQLQQLFRRKRPAPPAVVRSP